MSIENKFKNRIKTWKKKTISRDELESLLHTGSDAELYKVVSDAVAEGDLSPVKASGTNGNRIYPLYLKYRITVSEDYSEALSEIAMLHPDIIKSGYLQSRPEEYLKYKVQMEKLNRYLFKADRTVSISKKERSFDIFNEEKQLEDRSFRKLLDHLGLTADLLQYYETPEYCFNDYIPVRKSKLTLLICENKDIWFNIRRRMYEDRAEILFDVHIDGVVFGSGNKVSMSGVLSEYTRFMGADHVQYLYWGDIDRAGLNIFLSLVKGNPELDIRIFTPAYEEMLRLAKKCQIPDSGDHRERLGDYSGIYELFSGETKELLAAFVRDNKRVPQEIINYEALCRVMR